MLLFLQYAVRCMEVGQFSGAARLYGANPTFWNGIFAAFLLIGLADWVGILFGMAACDVSLRAVRRAETTHSHAGYWHKGCHMTYH